MISTDEVKKLADLARIKLSDDELENLRKDIASTLEYVDVIKKISIPDKVLPSPHLDLQNVMREDGEPHEGGVFTEEIMKQFPDAKDNYLRVKKILS